MKKYLLVKNRIKKNWLEAIVTKEDKYVQTNELNNLNKYKNKCFYTTN